MVKKNGSEYVCQNCGAVYPKWQGKCDACGEWNTIVEEKVGGEGFSNFNPKRKGSLLDFVSLSGSPQVLERLHTNIRELDRVCGGGLVPGSVILVGGDPGIGKSTLLLQVCASIANLPERPECYYISGEEAADQVKIRARRLGLETAPVNLASATDVKDIVTTLEKTRAAVVVIDSIQTMYLEEAESTPGSVAQVRACAYELIKLAKKKGFVLFLVGHVTKQGSIAGPRVLEHMVDTVLYFEGERGHHSGFCGRLKTVTAPPTKSACLRCRTRGWRKWKILRRCFWPNGRATYPVPACLPALRGRVRCWWKFRRWSARAAIPAPNERWSAGIPAGCRWCWRFWKPGAFKPQFSGRLSQYCRRAENFRTGGRSGGGNGDRFVADQPSSAR